MEDTHADHVDGVVRLFSALAHPIRAIVVHRLTESPCSMAELQQLTGASQPLLSHHLKVLREAHLVEGRRDGRFTEYVLVDDHVAHVFLDAHHHTEEHPDDHHH